MWCVSALKTRNRYTSEGTSTMAPSARAPATSKRVRRGAAEAAIVRSSGRMYGYCRIAQPQITSDT